MEKRIAFDAEHQRHIFIMHRSRTQNATEIAANEKYTLHSTVKTFVER